MNLTSCTAFLYVWRTNGLLKMVLETTYTHARAHLAKLCQQVTTDRDVVRITRRSGKDVILISADELAGLMETAHLLRSPKNKARLLSSLKKARRGVGSPQNLDQLRDEVQIREPKTRKAAKKR
jgi:antitoxin YefM